MPVVLLINPNSNPATTAAMLDAARPHLPPGWTLRGATAATGPAMILDVAALVPAAAEVERIGRAGGADAVVVAAFADPGAAALRRALGVPVVGIGAAALREAGFGGRRFGVATTTPGLRAAIEEAVRELELEQGFTGVRLTAGEPLRLAGDPDGQDAALERAALRCLEEDGAEAVVIGGGPLGGSAARLRARLSFPVVEPVPAAMRELARLVASSG